METFHSVIICWYDCAMCACSAHNLLFVKTQFRRKTLLSDTVGFISDLPIQVFFLVIAFWLEIQF
jgi:hypothetical protein